MRMPKEQVDIVLELPGVVLRQQMGFGGMSVSGQVSAEYFSLAAGTDTTPLFVGLEGDLCQCPHWGYVLRGQITTTDANGDQETVRVNDLFHWPAGHNVRVDEDAEIVMFSPQHQHREVLDHMKAMVAG
ncbi:MAG: hypothetical protein WBW04_09570 [Nitrolancea sp.]